MNVWMQRVSLVCVALLLLGADKAAEVSVKGVHLCCGACVRDANAALKDLKGISDVGIDRNTKLIKFKADSKDAAKEAIQALADGGFYGVAKFGDDKLEFPDHGAKKGTKVSEITFEGVHLCCGACVTGAKEAVQDIPGAAEVQVDRNAGTVTVKGKEIDQLVATEALLKGGFFGTVKK